MRCETKTIMTSVTFFFQSTCRLFHFPAFVTGEIFPRLPPVTFSHVCNQLPAPPSYMFSRTTVTWSVIFSRQPKEIPTKAALTFHVSSRQFPEEVTPEGGLDLSCSGFLVIVGGTINPSGWYSGCALDAPLVRH